MSGSIRDEREITDGVYGWLESPGPQDRDLEDVLVSGWTFSRRARIIEVFVKVTDHRENVRYGLRRGDVQEAYPADSGAAYSGFLAFLKVGRPSFGPVRMEIWGRVEDGPDIKLFTRQLTSHPVAAVARRSVRQAKSTSSAVLRMFRLGRSTEPASTLSAGREALESSSRLMLRTFLASGASLHYPEHPAPLVSIVVVLWNRAELTFRCLRAVSELRGLPVEVVLVDNQSTDETPELLARVVGATVVRNGSNLGFTIAANLGARAARGELLLFLNNDAEMMLGALERLVATLSSDPTIGAVGGKQVFPDGRLQEAGSIIWSDGSCEAYGRNGDPDAGEFNFQRDVDYCSGALLLTRRDLFERVGGFDERYQPAYYEDVDYCVKVWQSGLRVVYQPASVVIHFEFGSATSPGAAIKLQHERKAIFSALRLQWVSAQHSKADGTLVARTRRRGRHAVLVIDDAWPEPRQGSGFPRAAAILRALVQLDYIVTFYPMREAERPVLPRDELSEVEVVGRSGIGHLAAFLRSRGDFDAIVVSRPHNLGYVKAAFGGDLSALGVPVVYDAEAVYALREISQRRIAGASPNTAEEQSLVTREIGLASGCAAVLTVNEIERRGFVEAGTSNVAVLGHALTPAPTAPDFDSRRGLLFVGALAADSPNEDAALFLVREVLPALEQAARQRIPVTIAGANVSDRVKALAGDGIKVHPDVADLSPFYASTRVFVAPTRFSAGIPLKLLEAAARGVPIVCTYQLAGQLSWGPGRDVMAGESPAEIARAIARVYLEPALWQRLREAALLRVTEECAPEDFRARLQGVLAPCLAGGRTGRRSRDEF